MSLTQAVKSKSLEEIVVAVEAAVKVYPADTPAEPFVNSVYGEVKLSTLDEESRIDFAEQELCYLRVEASKLAEGGAYGIELAKLIATNPLFRNIGNQIKGGLL